MKYVPTIKFFPIPWFRTYTRAPYWSDILASRTTTISCILSAGLILMYWKTLPPAVPLWYSKPWGQEQLAHPLWLLILPVSSFIIYVINSRISMSFASLYPTFAKILHLTSVFVSCLNLITLVMILRIVT